MKPNRATSIMLASIIRGHEYFYQNGNLMRKI